MPRRAGGRRGRHWPRPEELQRTIAVRLAEAIEAEVVDRLHDALEHELERRVREAVATGLTVAVRQVTREASALTEEHMRLLGREFGERIRAAEEHGRRVVGEALRVIARQTTLLNILQKKLEGNVTNVERSQAVGGGSGL